MSAESLHLPGSDLLRARINTPPVKSLPRRRPLANHGARIPRWEKNVSREISEKELLAIWVAQEALQETFNHTRIMGMKVRICEKAVAPASDLVSFSVEMRVFRPSWDNACRIIARCRLFRPLCGDWQPDSVEIAVPDDLQARTHATAVVYGCRLEYGRYVIYHKYSFVPSAVGIKISLRLAAEGMDLEAE